ncbi:MAG: GC-type dockerin domain-anchored protein, partial [Planctomycetota bacterium]
GQFGGILRARFVGSTDVLGTADINGATELRLSNLRTAELTIQFNTIDGIPGSPDAVLLSNIVTVQLLSLDTPQDRVATFVCLADSNEDGAVDPADFNAWVQLFNTNDFRADTNLDAEVTPADFNAWILAYNAGC